MTAHPQVPMPHLGDFTVDEGLEDLIDVLWMKGLTTEFSCIGPDETHPRHGNVSSTGYVSFKPDVTLPEALKLWESPVRGVSNPRIGFTRQELPDLLADVRSITDWQ